MLFSGCYKYAITGFIKNSNYVDFDRNKVIYERTGTTDKEIVQIVLSVK